MGGLKKRFMTLLWISTSHSFETITFSLTLPWRQCNIEFSSMRFDTKRETNGSAPEVIKNVFLQRVAVFSSNRRELMLVCSWWWCSLVTLWRDGSTTGTKTWGRRNFIILCWQFLLLLGSYFVGCRPEEVVQWHHLDWVVSVSTESYPWNGQLLGVMRLGNINFVGNAFNTGQ